MRSIVAVTNEINNAEKAADELVKQIEEKTKEQGLGRNSLGLIYCDADAPHGELARALAAKLPFGVFGCTGIATFDTDNGAQIMSVVLMVLTADDAVFSPAVTGPLTEENLRDEMTAAYRKAASALDCESKLIFLIPPYSDILTLDDYVDILSELSGDVPVFGGLPASSTEDGDMRVYAGGAAYADRAAVILTGGGARPVFSVQNVLSSHLEQKFEVTKAHKNIIYTVDGMPFTEFLSSLGMDVKELLANDNLASYGSFPLKVNLNKRDSNDGVAVARIIKKLNPADGSGELFDAIPEKSAVSVAMMKRQDIQSSCKMAVKEIQEKMAEAGKNGDYVYSALLCISCAGRHIVMADEKAMESGIILESMPKGLALAGFYSYGEICPTAFRENGRAVNRIHNESIVMCAL